MIQLILLLFRLYEFILIIRVLMSWIRVDPYHPVAVWIYRLTEPVLQPFRGLLPTERIGIDFSPLIVLFLLQILKRVLVQLLFSI
ncbi:MAG TPA: YggT family protein [Chitinispirillaceae bacterium]|nr:YggT family protein [Chitinispirillaceae bacterium]